MEKVINARELQSYQEIFSEAQRIFVTCFNEYGRRLTKISGRKDELKELYDTIGKKELEKIISSAATKSGQLMDVVWEDTDYANVKIVAVPNYEYERYNGSWGIIVVYRQEEYKDEKINADVKLYPTKGKYMKVTFNGINRGVKLLSLFSELFITAMYDNNRTMNELYEIKKHEGLYVALKEILNNLGSSIFVIDKQTKEILFANDVFTKSMEIDFVGKQCRDYNFGCMSKKCENCIQMQNDNLYI